MDFELNNARGSTNHWRSVSEFTMTCLQITTASAKAKASLLYTNKEQDQWHNNYAQENKGKGDVGGDTIRNHGLQDAHAQGGAEGLSVADDPGQGPTNHEGGSRVAGGGRRAPGYLWRRLLRWRQRGRSRSNMFIS